MKKNNSPMKIDKIILYKLRMELNDPFTTSFGTFQEKSFFVTEVIDKNGLSGFGESVAFCSPWYSEETIGTNEHIMSEFLIPSLLDEPLDHPKEVSDRFNAVRRNTMAKAALEGAVWDLFAKRREIPLASALGGEKKEIDVGISIGIQPSVKRLLEVIEGYAAEGYKRMKIKIKPGWDVDVMRQVRKTFPHLPLMADANSAYSLADLDHLKKLDDLDLMMIEQPLAHDDIVDHANLQKALQTPICLDESIHSFEDTRRALELGSCKIINIKIGRVGGLWEALKIHNYCAEHNVPVWCGGMLEAGVGRAHNIALTSLANFTLPGDTAASSRYWKRDIIEPEVIVQNGMIKIPDRPGIGYDINRETLEAFTEKTMEFK